MKRAATLATRRTRSEAEVFDRELADLPPALRWRDWMGRIEAVLFASAEPVSRDDLARVVGQGVSVEMLIADIRAELDARPYELVEISDGWMFRTRTRFADAIKAATNPRQGSLGFTEMELAVLCAIAHHQPIDRAGLKDIFGKDISRDLLARLRHNNLVTSGPRVPPTRRAAYICHNADLPDDVRSAKPPGLARDELKAADA